MPSSRPTHRRSRASPGQSRRKASPSSSKPVPASCHASQPPVRACGRLRCRRARPASFGSITAAFTARSALSRQVEFEAQHHHTTPAQHPAPREIHVFHQTRYLTGRSRCGRPRPPGRSGAYLPNASLMSSPACLRLPAVWSVWPSACDCWSPVASPVFSLAWPASSCALSLALSVKLIWVRLFWSDLIVSVRNCPATICGGERGMAGVLQPATTCSNSSRDRPNTPAASLLLLRIPLAPLLSHVLVPTPTNVAGRSPSNDQVRHKTQVTHGAGLTPEEPHPLYLYSSPSNPSGVR